MIKLTVSRNDHLYECFPDIARTPDGTLVCIYRECMMHAPFPFSRIAVRRSLDGGKTWLDRDIIVECVARADIVDANRPWLAEDALAGYEETRSRITEDWRTGSSINCPRLACLADGTLFLIADIATVKDVNEVRSGQGFTWNNRVWRSKDGNVTWEGGEVARLPKGLAPSVTQLRSGDIMVGLSFHQGRHETQFVCRSCDGGHTWADPIYIPDPDDRNFSEGSFVELDDGVILGILRTAPGGLGYKVLSKDGGKSWRGPFETHLRGLDGRPKAGLLASGEIAVTYRCDIPNDFLAMHVMSQDAARLEGVGDMIERKPMPEDIPGRLAADKGEARLQYMTSYYPGRTLILDCDRSVHRDCGYSGWVQMPSGDIFVVDYINDDAPLAQIRGYLVNRSDYLLFPDGDLPSLHPSWQPFREMAAAMARRQYAAGAGETLPAASQPDD